ncbi:O-antigen polymerase [Lewinella sp. W8]|uniref:O-antigen polymerase n=1 Tax=Lewinella sp. W8 TaxID=2528208 RepID=UPI0010686A45|nr:O-antigen polymerase [Lewinella sp. W8]MTB53172.1 oligosaccharide repeat unit polymerase [Lewinella sp. W8]
MDRALPRSVTDSNPFVEISVWTRLLLVGYILLYRVCLPGIEYLVYDQRPLVILRWGSNLLFVLLLFGPLLFYQRGKLGWLHPFILPGLIGIASSLAKNFWSLLTPFYFRVPESFSFVGLEHFSQTELAWTVVRHDWIAIMGLVAYYLSFLLARRLKVPRLRILPPSRLSLRLFFGGLIGLAAAYLIISRNGGVEATILGLAGGRFRFREKIGGGHLIVLTEFLKYAWLIWFAYRPRARFNPLFWMYVLGSLAVIFVVSGSRSGILFPLIFLGLIYVIHTRKIPTLTIGVAAFVGVIMVGILGQIRSAGNRGDAISLELLTETSISEKLELTSAEVEDRINGNMMVVGKAMDQVGPLWGRTYLAGVFFWVPRAIWKNKPRGAGAYAGNILYYGRSLERNSFGGDALGIPVSGYYEAYWNFWYPGVVLIAVLFGLLHRFSTNVFLKNRGKPLVWVVYLLVVGFTSMATRSIVDFAQGISIIVLIALLCYLWRPGIIYQAISLDRK